MEDCARYIAEVQSQPWYRRAFPGAAQSAPVAVTTSSGTSHARLDGTGIGAAPYDREQTARCERMLLHELAHVVAARRAYRPGAEYAAEREETRDHTHAWRVNYVTLVRHQLGYRAARYLRDSFKSHDLPTNR